MRRNFEHIFNKRPCRIALSNKLPSQWRTSFSCKCPFLWLVLNKKTTHGTPLNLHATQKSYLLSIISPCLCKDKFFHSNSNLTNSVDVKCLYEKCRLIFVSTRIYALFKKLDTPWYNNSCFTHAAWKVSKYGVFLFWRENTDQKKLCIWTLFTQCHQYLGQCDSFSLDEKNVLLISHYLLANYKKKSCLSNSRLSLKTQSHL